MLDRPYVASTELVPSVPGAPPVMMIVNHPQPIRFRTLDAYAERYGFEGEGYELFTRFMRALDSEYLKVKAEQRAGNTVKDEGDPDGE